jgi:hypothetical protein
MERMSFKKPVAVAAAALLGIGALTAACGGESSPAVAAKCADAQDFGGMPPEAFEVKEVAKELHVTEAQVLQGGVKAVKCDKQLSMNQIGDQFLVVGVEGQPANCMAIGSMDNPMQNALSKNLLVLCPAK